MRQSRLERLVDQQPPHLLERIAADELLDVDPAVAEGTALAIGLRDLGLERNNALEAGLEVARGAHRANGTQTPADDPPAFSGGDREPRV